MVMIIIVTIIVAMIIYSGHYNGDYDGDDNGRPCKSDYGADDKSIPISSCSRNNNILSDKISTLWIYQRGLLSPSDMHTAIRRASERKVSLREEDEENVNDNKDI